ncbi:hypothetical protein LP419_03675 [Massilia sp. H-1]|nr:hypothetical protein LP419_03675 [Massilia sp. H-1]
MRCRRNPQHRRQGRAMPAAHLRASQSGGQGRHGGRQPGRGAARPGAARPRPFLAGRDRWRDRLEPAPRAGLATSASRACLASGTLDAATWKALAADPADALVAYTVAEADVATSPVYTIPEEMADKARLPALGYASAAEALGEKFHASAALLQRLNPGKDLARAGEQIVVPNVLGTEPLPKA